MGGRGEGGGGGREAGVIWPQGVGRAEAGGGVGAVHTRQARRMADHVTWRGR